MEPREPIIIAGNPGDGFEFYGPFDREIDAADWADTGIDHQDWWVVYLTRPDE